MNKKPLFIAAILAALLTGCGDQSPDTPIDNNSATTTPTPPVKTEAGKPSVAQGLIQGTILGKPFQAQQATLENNILTIRQGEEFFADLDAKFFIFDDGDLTGKKFVIDKEHTGMKPHIHLGIMKKGEKVPSHEIMMDGYELELRFAQPETHGLPFTVRLNIPDKQTRISGEGIAAFSDVRLTAEKNVDLTNDSFDTLRHVGRLFLAQRHGIEASSISSDFGVSYRSFDNDKAYPKTGFVGFVVGQNKYKLQLLKDEAGWKVARALEPNQIAPAHPVEISGIEMNKRAQAASAANLAAAQAMEAELNKEHLMPHVLSANIRCYLNKDHDVGSCEGTYTAMQDGEKTCRSKNYLLRLHDQWQVERHIERTQKVDYKTGGLKTHKPFKLHCG